MNEPRTPIIYCHDFWHRWMLVREASRPRASRKAVLGIVTTIATLDGASAF